MINIPENEIELKAIRSSGPGGQNVNKVATAIQLRFDSQNSSALTSEIKSRLLQLSDRRISREGVILITARQHRTQEANRTAALNRLYVILEKAQLAPKPRKATRPTRASVQKRLKAKTQRSQIKQTRGRVDPGILD